jgi:hypothetical protein
LPSEVPSHGEPRNLVLSFHQQGHSDHSADCTPICRPVHRRTRQLDRCPLRRNLHNTNTSAHIKTPLR